MSERIVVGTDGSQTAGRAVQEAVRLASALGAELHVVTANWSRAAPNDHTLAGPIVAYGPVDDGRSRAAAENAVMVARARGVAAESHIVDRDPADALLQVAGQVGASLIVVGNRGMSGGRRLLGSVPNTISHDARCNVLIVATS